MYAKTILRLIYVDFEFPLKIYDANISLYQKIF